MPTYMIHLCVARKFNPEANIDFYIGNLAPDSVAGEDKHISHLRNASDMESALKEFALRINTENEYLKGVLLHLFVDWQWNDILILPDFIKKNGDDWYQKYYDESGLTEHYLYHNTDWAYELWEQMDLCDDFDFVETKFIVKDNIKDLIKGYRGRRRNNWEIETKIKPSTEFHLLLINKFADDVVAYFNNWLGELKYKIDG